jgi:L-alanine-DL-glutamate epimerase-like enolase superfamily enzyme
LHKLSHIYEISVPLQGDITNAVVNFSSHDVSLVMVVSNVIQQGRPVVGYGFNSIGRFAQPGILNRRLIPRVLKADPASLLTQDEAFFDPVAISSIAMKNEKPGGHGDRACALAALELAVWDLNAKLAEEPAWSWIAKQTSTRVRQPLVKTYAAGGYYYSADSLNRLQEELKAYRDVGFDAFKIKIGGASLSADIERIDAAIEIAGNGRRVAVDANGRFDTETAVKYLEAMSSRKLRWFEEPGDPLDFKLLNQLTHITDMPLATGENLFSTQDTLNLLRYGGMKAGRDIFQMDAGLSYGLSEYIRMLSDLESAGMKRTQCFPHGGHLINLHIAAGLNLGGCEAYPGVFNPFGGFSPACELIDGKIKPSQAPGFGLEEKPELKPYLSQLLEAI